MSLNQYGLVEVEGNSALFPNFLELEPNRIKPELWPAYPSTFSGGEQQKVNLARALIRPPRLLLLDEPTASLEAGARSALARRLSQLKRDGVALLGVFHHPADVAGLVDAEVLLTSGEAEDTRITLPAREQHVD